MIRMSGIAGALTDFRSAAAAAPCASARPPDVILYDVERKPPHDEETHIASSHLLDGRAVRGARLHESRRTAGRIARHDHARATGVQ
jgi:hypothetical protein